MPPADAEFLYRIYQTEGILRYFPTNTPPPFERVESFITSQQEHWEKFGYGNWGIVPRGESQIIGWAGLHSVATAAQQKMMPSSTITNNFTIMATEPINVPELARKINREQQRQNPK